MPAEENQALSQHSPGALRVVEVGFQTDPRWETFVAAHPRGLIYHHPHWLQAIEQAFGYKPLGLACEDAEGQLRGILPLFHTHGLLTGRGLSLPRTPVAGPLAYHDQVMAALVQAAVERVPKRPGAKLQIKMQSAQLNGLVDGVVGAPWAETYILNLPAQMEDLRFGNSRNHASIKRAVNKATRSGVQVRQAETEGDLRAWYELYLETMRWHAVPPKPYRLFESVWELLRSRGLMRLLLAEQHEAGRSRLLSGSIFLMFGQTVFYAFNGRRPDTLSLRPNEAIHWKAIHDACQEGFHHYDFGEVIQHDGLARFKSKWGAEPRWVYRYYYPAPSGKLDPGTLKTGGYPRRLAKAAWRRMPLKASAQIGDWLYRYM